MLIAANLYAHIVMGSLMFFTSVFMIFLILIQRGRGGGLAGALGGSGGSSAFGAKAGDTFTRVTAGLAMFWFVLCLLTILFLQGPRPLPPEKTTGSGAGSSASAVDENGVDADGNKASAPDGTGDSLPFGASENPGETQTDAAKTDAAGTTDNADNGSSEAPGLTQPGLELDPPNLDLPSAPETDPPSAEAGASEAASGDGGR